MTHCYHCGTAFDANRGIIREIDGVNQSMCCEGCATVAALIHESGLNAYYEKRTSMPRPVQESEQHLPQTYSEIFDDELIHERFVGSENGLCSANFIIHNMHCPTCVWLIESRLASLPGIQRAKINFRAQKLTLEWRKEQVSLSNIVRCVQDLGYGLVPYSSTAFSETIHAQHQDLLKRLGVAGIFGMQIMVIAVVLYASAWSSIEIKFEELFRRLSLIFVLPVMFYAASPIFLGAWRDVKQKTATMDVPIALALLIAFIASLAATLTGKGEIYYDSIAMFVFFQLVARFLEKGAFRRMTDRITSLSASSPSHANKLADPEIQNSFQVVPALRLAVNDYVLVKPGEAIPTDGKIISGATDIDEAFLTGESRTIQREAGDVVLGGSINVSNPITVQVAKPTSESVLASIVKLLEDSVSEKPSSRRLTDRIAGRFSVTVVFLALCVAGFWYGVGSPDWLSHTISVLVVACPCALALAVPTALTASINSAASRNILIAHPDAIRELAKADTFLFDKTGTLTESKARLEWIETFGAITDSQAMEAATSLAHFSDHPVSRALVHGSKIETADVVNVELTHGGGIRGKINGKQYFLGSRAFVELCSSVIQNNLTEHAGLVAYLGDKDGILARFHFDNPVRSEVNELIAELKSMPVHLALVTGDRQSEAEKIADELEISEVNWECSPEDKLRIIQSHQDQGRYVAMVGDGINDAPTLAVANVSVTPARAQEIAKAHADVVLLDDRLNLLSTALSIAKFTVRIMRDNTVWAIAYNLTGIALAAAGFVPPLVAAIGMSASSILVVGNSLRIVSYKGRAA